MCGVVGEKIGSECDEELVTGRIFQLDIHPDIVGEDAVAQCFYGLVVLHDLSFLHILGADIVGEFVVLSLAEVEALHGETADGLSFVFYLSVFFDIYSRQFL